MFSHAKLIAALMLAADASIAPIGARRLSLRSVAPDVAERVRTMADPDISDELRASLLACIIEDDLPGMAADLGERVRAMGDPSLSAEQRASIFAIDEDLFGDKSAPVAAVRKSVAPDVAERVRAMANAEGDEMRAKLLAFLEEYDFPNFDADVVERLRTVGDSSLSAEQRAKIFAIDDDLFGDKSAPVAAVQKSVAPDVAERVRAMANAEDDEMRAILLKFLEDNDFANFDADVVERLRAVGDSSLSAEQRAKIFAIDEDLFGEK